MWKDHAYRCGDIVRDPKTGEGYRIQELIGRGAYSEVYRAVCVRTGVLYALKILQLHRQTSQKTRKRHRREGELLLRLRNPNLVQVHAVIESEDGRVILVMDLLVGRTLAQLREDCGGRIPINTALEVAMQVCNALTTIHGAQVVHRDIKPDNIFMGDDCVVRVCDLGVSQFPHELRITTEDTTIGTVEYMSPEQLYKPELVGPQSDLFALGVVLYESIAGVSPFALNGTLSTNMKELGFQIIFRPHVPLRVVAPEAPEPLAVVIDSLLMKEPAERYASAEVARAVLGATLSSYLKSLAERNIEPPRISFVTRLPPVPPIDTDQLPLPSGSANPFLSISVPPLEPTVGAETSASERAKPSPGATEPLPVTTVTTVETGRPAFLDLGVAVQAAPVGPLPPGSTEGGTGAPASAPAGPVERIAGVPKTIKMPVYPQAPTPGAGPPVTPSQTLAPSPPALPAPLARPAAAAPAPAAEDKASTRGRRETSSTPAVTLPANYPRPGAQHAPGNGPPVIESSGESDTAASAAIELSSTRTNPTMPPSGSAAPEQRPARKRAGVARVATVVAVPVAAAAILLWRLGPFQARHPDPTEVTVDPSTDPTATPQPPPARSQEMTVEPSPSAPSESPSAPAQSSAPSPSTAPAPPAPTPPTTAGATGVAVTTAPIPRAPDSNATAAPPAGGPVRGQMPTKMAKPKETAADACTPRTTCPANLNCGTVPDGCGGTVRCGTCGQGQTCGGDPLKPNVCTASHRAFGTEN